MARRTALADETREQDPAPGPLPRLDRRRSARGEPARTAMMHGMAEDDA